MKVIHAFGAKDVRLVEVPEPTPGEGQVLVRVLASGICGSDKWLWRHPEPVKNVQGHEVAGEVIGLGPGVRRLKVGDRVAVNNVGGCGSCPACRAGEFVLCPSWDGSRDINNGYGEILAAWERNCLKLRDEVDMVTAAQIFDNFGTPLSALDRGDVRPGDDVLITGCGPIGLAAILLAKLRGAFVVAADPLPARRDFAASLGADITLPPDEALPAAVRSVTDGLGVRVAVECSGKSPSYPVALAALRVGGTFVCVGEGAQVDLHPSDTLIRRRLTMAGSWYSGMRQGQLLQDWIAEGKIRPSLLVSHTAPLAEFPRLFQMACEQPDVVMKAMIVG
jgi:threonine dehydrogenase-like Zn-dependent dehydrogenase